MMLFWLCALALALLASLLLAAPLLRPLREEERSLLSLNAQVFRERLTELEKDRQEGRIDDETCASLKAELERNLLSLADSTPPQQQQSRVRGLFLLIVVILPLGALAFYYFEQYNPALSDLWQMSRTMAPVVDDVIAGRQPPADAPQDMPDFVHALQLYLQSQPNDARAWFLLGIGYMQVNMGGQALQALERAWRLDPDRSDVELAYAQALIFANEGKLIDQSRQLLQAVLAKNPQDEGALILLGVGAYRAGDFATAISALELWQSSHSQQGAPGSDATQEIDKILTDARAQLAAGPRSNVSVAAGVTVKVSVDPALQAKIQPGDTVFVYAKAENGPPMPLAVVRKGAAELPFTVELNDSQSMLPSMKLSSVVDVTINARISHDGTVMPQEGDLEAIAVPLRQTGKSSSVELLIREERR